MGAGELSIILAWAGVIVTGWLALLFVLDPAQGMRHTTHRLDQLPRVMADRYIAMAFLAVGAAWKGDPAVIAWLFAAFAFMGLADAVIYARAGQPMGRHLAAGLAAAVVAAIAAWAAAGT